MGLGNVGRDTCIMGVRLAAVLVIFTLYRSESAPPWMSQLDTDRNHPPYWKALVLETIVSGLQNTEVHCQFGLGHRTVVLSLPPGAIVKMLGSLNSSGIRLTQLVLQLDVAVRR